MPSRKARRICDCSLCGGQLVNENLWVAHQTPIHQSPVGQSSTSTTSATSRFPDPFSALPPSDIFHTAQSLSSPSLDLKAQMRARKEARRERNHHTLRAATNLRAWIAETDEILENLRAIGSYQELDSLQGRVAQLWNNLHSTNRRTTSLGLLRDQLHRRLGSLDALLVDSEANLGERQDPIRYTMGKL